LETVNVDLGLAHNSNPNPPEQPTYPNDPRHGDVVGTRRGKNVTYFPGASSTHQIRTERDGAALLCGDEFKIIYHHTNEEGNVEPHLEVKTYPWGEGAREEAQSLLSEYREQVESYLLPEAVEIPEELDFELD